LPTSLPDAWRLYYDDGSTFSSADGTWAQAPNEGVQVLVTYQEPPYKVLHDGVDTYRLPGRKTVKHGRWMDTDAFYAIQREAFESHWEA
jgi:hypothetical protein